MALPFYSPLFHQPAQFGKQYKSRSYSLYNTFQPSVNSSLLCLTFPQTQHNNNYSVWTAEFKTLCLEAPFGCAFLRMIYEAQKY